MGALLFDTNDSQKQLLILTNAGIVEPISTEQAVKDYLSKEVNPTLLKGLTELCKMKPGDPVVSRA